MNDTPAHSDQIEANRAKWQHTVNLLAKNFNVPAALIMHIQKENIEVLLASETKKNPFKDNLYGKERHFDENQKALLKHFSDFFEADLKYLSKTKKYKKKEKKKKKY